MLYDCLFIYHFIILNLQKHQTPIKKVIFPNMIVFVDYLKIMSKQDIFLVIY